MVENNTLIPEDLALKTAGDREALKEIVKTHLKAASTEQLISFAVRAALRTAWSLEHLKIKSPRKLDAFYFYWLRSLSAASTVVFSRLDNNQFAAADAAYTAHSGAGFDC